MAKSASKRSPKKPTKTRPSQRKGSVVKSVPKNARDLLKRLTKENQGVKEMRKYENGSIGVFFKNGKFRFITGGNNLQPRKKGSKVKYPRISKLAAKRALLKYYNNKEYKSPSNRKSALTRDICSDNKPTNRTSLYRRSPHLYDYPGVDDGSQCPKGHKVYHKKKITRSVKKNLLNRLKSKTANRKKPTKKSPKLSPKRKSKVTRRTQKGGDPLTDKDIAEIVEQYNAEHGMDADHGMDGGSLAHMGISDMDADHEMDADHAMEGGGMDLDAEHGMFAYPQTGGFFGIFGSKKNEETASQPESEPEQTESVEEESTEVVEEPVSEENVTLEVSEPVSPAVSALSGGSGCGANGLEAGCGMDADHEMDADHGMDAEHGMEGGGGCGANGLEAGCGMDADHEMDVDHGMEDEHGMEGGGGCGANGLEAGCGMDADHEMDVDHGMEDEHGMEGGGGCGANGLEAGCGMDADHEMDADHGMEAEHMMEGGMCPDCESCPDCSSREEDSVSQSSEQLGGSELSLKQAVNLLRQYYNEKYSN